MEGDRDHAIPLSLSPLQFGGTFVRPSGGGEGREARAREAGVGLIIMRCDLVIDMRLRYQSVVRACGGGVIHAYDCSAVEVLEWLNRRRKDFVECKCLCEARPSLIWEHAHRHPKSEFQANLARKRAAST